MRRNFAHHISARLPDLRSTEPRDPVRKNDDHPPDAPGSQINAPGGDVLGANGRIAIARGAGRTDDETSTTACDRAIATGVAAPYAICGAQQLS